MRRSNRGDQSSPRSSRTADLEGDLDVGTGFASALSENELILQRAFAPIDVARVVPFAHGTKPEDLVARTAARKSRAAEPSARFVGSKAERIDCGVDDELCRRRQPRATSRTDRKESAWRYETRCADRVRGAEASGGRPRPARYCGLIEKEAPLVGRLRLLGRGVVPRAGAAGHRGGGADGGAGGAVRGGQARDAGVGGRVARGGGHRAVRVREARDARVRHGVALRRRADAARVAGARDALALLHPARHARAAARAAGAVGRSCIFSSKKKGSKILSKLSGSIPFPLSFTIISMPSMAVCVITHIFPPSGGRACRALSNKLTITCLMSSASTEISPIDGSSFLFEDNKLFF